MNNTIEFWIFKLVEVIIFSLNWHFFFFLNQICPKKEFPVKNWKIALSTVTWSLLTKIKLFRTGFDRHNGGSPPSSRGDNYDVGIEASIHYLLRCRFYSVQRVELLNDVYILDSTLQNSSEDQLLTVLLYGSEKICLERQ